MEIKRAAELLRGLADGRDPITGARLPDESVYNHPEIIRALHCVLQELQTRQTGAQAVNAGRWSRPGIWSFRRKPPSSRPTTAPSSPTKRSTPASRSCWKPDISDRPEQRGKR